MFILSLPIKRILKWKQGLVIALGSDYIIDIMLELVELQSVVEM